MIPRPSVLTIAHETGARAWSARAVLRLSLALLAALGAVGCSGDRAESKQAQPKRPPVAVAVAKVEQKPMALQIQAIGTVEASAVVAVKAQVGGELLRVHFKEGDDVKKGDLLFTIDPRVYETAVAQAQANVARDVVQVQQARAVLERDIARVTQARAALARDEAQARNAWVQERRYADLHKRELIAQEQYDQIKTTAESLAAGVRADQADVQSAEETVRADQAAIRSAEQVVRADEAALENAKLQLGYTTIRAPVDGRTGSMLLNQGNVIRAGGTTDSTLVVINQIRPIYASFTVPQQQLASVKRYLAEGTLGVTAVPSDDPRPVKGVVSFVDNAVDATTGTIRLKATFPNQDSRLWPGQFVNVALTLATEADALVVPAQALQTGQQGPFVFVVKPDSTVEIRRVTVTRTQGGETIIAKGLEPGESVVTDGQPRLVAGAKVDLRAAERGGEGKGKGKGKGGEGAAEGKGGKGAGDAGGESKGKAAGETKGDARTKSEAKP